MPFLGDVACLVRGTTFLICVALALGLSTCSKSGSDLRYLKCYQLSVIELTWLNASRRTPRAELRFGVFGANYTLTLRQMSPERMLLHPDAQLQRQNAGAESALSAASYYEGWATATNRAKGTHAHGSLIGGRFHGVVRAGNETLFIEPYTATGAGTSTPGPTHLIYRLLDVVAYENVTFRMASDEGAGGGDPFAGANYSGGATRRARQAAAAPAGGSASARRYCSVHVVVDSSFVSQMAAGSVQTALNVIIYHLQEASSLFSKTDFDGDGLPDAVALLITNVTLIDKVVGFDYEAPAKSKDPQRFLDLFSTTKYPRTCVALLFTYQDMPQTLGMAWVARPSPMMINSHGIGSQKNHGFVTCSLDGKRVSRPGVSITVGHEVGHSFGSHHDAIERGTLCAPSNADGGAYIMYPMVSTGAYQNNFRFSPCSRRDIDAVLASRRLVVLTALGRAYCGNTIVEDGEECDCGDSTSCDEVDACCTPPEGNAGGDRGCRIRRSAGAMCSSRSMPCCAAGCKVAPQSDASVCSPASDCTYASSCDGVNGYCPASPPRPDGTLCNDLTQVCVGGRCADSACSLLNLTQCGCDDEADRCALCCQTAPGQCTPFRTLEPSSGAPSWLPAGELCAGEAGYCDGAHVCRVPGEGVAGSQLVVELSAAAGGWLADNWSVALIASALVALSAFIYRRSRSRLSAQLWGEAHQSGAIARAYFEARRRHRQLAAVLQEFDRRGAAIAAGERPYTGSAARFADVFPTVGAEPAREALLRAASQEETVRRLLVVGHPMRIGEARAGHSSAKHKKREAYCGGGGGGGGGGASGSRAPRGSRSPSRKSDSSRASSERGEAARALSEGKSSRRAGERVGSSPGAGGGNAEKKQHAAARGLPLTSERRPSADGKARKTTSPNAEENGRRSRSAH